MAVAAWVIFDKKGQAQKSFTIADGNFLPAHTSYMGSGTWIAVTAGNKISIVKVVDHAGVLHSYEVFDVVVNFGLNHTARAITFDGKSVWVLSEDTLASPVVYQLSQMRSPRSTTVTQVYAMFGLAGVDLVGLCMDGPGFGGDDFRGRYFYTIGDDNTVYKLFVKTAVRVVAEYAVAAGFRSTFSGIEFDGMYFWTVGTAVDGGGASVGGKLRQWTPDFVRVSRVLDYGIGIEYAGLSTDGHRFYSRSG